MQPPRSSQTSVLRGRVNRVPAFLHGVRRGRPVHLCRVAGNNDWMRLTWLIPYGKYHIAIALWWVHEELTSFNLYNIYNRVWRHIAVADVGFLEGVTLGTLLPLPSPPLPSPSLPFLPSGPIPSLPPVISLPLPFHHFSPPIPSPLPLEVGPLNPAKGSGGTL